MKKVAAAIAAVVSVIYIVFPFDFVPDVLLPFGIMDDAGAAAVLIWALREVFGKKGKKPDEKSANP